MKAKHGGWASQAKRRQEEYLGCTSCGMTKHPWLQEHYQQAYPKQDVEPIKIFGLVIFLLFMYAVIIYCLPIVLEAVVR